MSDLPPSGTSPPGPSAEPPASLPAPAPWPAPAPAGWGGPPAGQTDPAPADDRAPAPADDRGPTGDRAPAPVDDRWPGGVAPSAPAPVDDRWPSGAAPGGSVPGSVPGGSVPGGGAAPAGGHGRPPEWPGAQPLSGPWTVGSEAVGVDGLGPPRRFDLKRALLLFAVIGGIALCGIGLLVYVGWSIGPLALGVGIAAAILPVPVLVLCFLWLDRYEPEPWKYLAFCFAWGACVATVAALAVNTGAGSLLHKQGMPESLVAVLVAPVIEEVGKAFGPLLLFWRRRRAFSGVVDGIVYAGLSATGFAMMENILYLGGLGFARTSAQSGVATGIVAVLIMFVMRICLSGFAHPLFTSMTGIGLGVAARSSDRRVRWRAPLAGLLAAMMLHGAWNFMSTLAEQDLLFLVFGYLAVMAPIFLGMVGFALWLRGSEGRLTARILADYAKAGWFSPPEVAALATVGRRLAARRWAKRVAGPPGMQAMRGYQFAAVQLALLRDGMRRGLGQPDAEDEERRLLRVITTYRAAFTGVDRQAPPAVWDGTRYRLRFPDGSVREVPPPASPVVPIPVPVPAPPAYQRFW